MSSQVQALYGDVDFSFNPEDSRLAAVEALILDNVASQPEPSLSDQANSEALYLLRWCFALLYDPVSGIEIKQTINIWVKVVPQAYLEAIRNLHPGALVILAHWCMMLNQAKMYWYLRDSAAKVLSCIWDVLGDEWREKISWPLQVVSI